MDYVEIYLGAFMLLCQLHGDTEEPVGWHLKSTEEDMQLRSANLNHSGVVPS